MSWIAGIASFEGPVIKLQADNIPPWKDDDVAGFLQASLCRQILILTDTIGAYETGLTLMALQSGFEVFLAVPDLSTESPSRIARLRQASAFVLAMDEVIADIDLQSFH